ncbi:hypothetical protein ACOMCU_00865 [Lysinibacillus sp. UGB7]|uniref:hypothetical protein n=1 Tax=Lysinibacillus sp. UGB7 TaxID=3411039 RepID=UPI003B7FE98C
MLKKGDKVEYEGVITTCLGNEFNFLGTGPAVVELEDFEGWINAKLPKLITKLEILNSIPVLDYDTDSDDLYTVTCIDNNENREKIMHLGYKDDDIDRFVAEEGSIEMTHFAWKIANYAELGDSFNGWFVTEE